MVTSGNATASQLMIMGQEALAYVRGCSASPGRLASIFAGEHLFDDDANEITLPPLHEIMPEGDVPEFIERLRRLGFTTHISCDSTYITWRAVTALPSAWAAAERSMDSLNPLVDERVSQIRKEIEKACDLNQYEIVTKEIMRDSERVRTEVVIYLKNQGYTVTKHRETYHHFDGHESYHAGYNVSWHPPKTRDIEEIPWWKFWRKK